MGAESWAAVSALGVSALTAAGTVYTAKAGRRTRRQERRDDFTVVTDAMRTEIDSLRKRVDEQELQSTEQRARLAGQEYTIRYLCGWIRSMVGFIQASGLEPPPAPRPMPEEVRPYLHDLGI